MLGWSPHHWVLAFMKLNFGSLEISVTLVRKDVVSSPHLLILELVVWLACFVIFSWHKQLFEWPYMHIVLVLLDFHFSCLFCDVNFNTNICAMSKPCLHATKIWAFIYPTPSSCVNRGCKNMKISLYSI